MGRSHGRRGYYPSSVHVEFEVDKFELEDAFLQVVWFSHVGIIP
jgi:hypothetical protein